MSKRKQHAPDFKAKVALEALKSAETDSALARRFGVHLLPAGVCGQTPRGDNDPAMKQSLLEGASGVFEGVIRKAPEVDGAQVKTRHARIGELAVAKDCFGQIAPALGREGRREMIEPANPGLSIDKQCKLLSISRSSFYYRPKGETAPNPMLMRLIRCPAGSCAA